MSGHAGAKGRNPAAAARKKPRREDIARQQLLNKQRPFANLRAYREQQEKQDTKEEVT